MGTTRSVVLVVEDEWLLRELVAEELRGAGLEVLEASTAEGAIAYMAAGQRCDVVFTDIQLAGHLSGWELAEQLRAARPHLPVIYASGNSVDNARKVPGSVFFSKPYRPADVVDACRRLC
jgi:CheY-like chemotaxis protein